MINQKIILNTRTFSPLVQCCKQLIHPSTSPPPHSLFTSHFHFTIGGSQSVVSGTSASTPVAAAFITLINAARLRQGALNVMLCYRFFSVFYYGVL